MLRCVKMPGCMLVRRVVAAAHVATLEAEAEVNPRAAGGEALLATLGRVWCHVAHRAEMCTLHAHAEVPRNA